MTNKLIFFVLILFTSCSNDDDISEIELSEYELEIISYFKEIALGFEYGESTEVTRKWNTTMKIFLDGNVSTESTNKVINVVSEINSLATDGFSVEIVNDTSLSNCYIYFGAANEFVELFPDAEDLIGSSNFATFNVTWNNNYINEARIFIDTEQTDYTLQKSLILEEITQVLGLGKDSPRLENSIFYETINDGGFATEYADIDKELIRLLYHPDMEVGLTENQVDSTLKKILSQQQ